MVRRGKGSGLDERDGQDSCLTASIACRKIAEASREYEDMCSHFDTEDTEYLRQFLRNRTLYAGGERADVLQRVKKYALVPDFTITTAKELKEFLREWNLDTSGNKQALQDRIIQTCDEFFADVHVSIGELY